MLEKLPNLYLSDEQKRILDGLVLLDPRWLTEMMKHVMEIKAGRGPELTNEEQLRLEDTGCAELSLLKRCWSIDGDEDAFHRLLLMLQAFCLVFPLPEPEIFPASQPCSLQQGSKAMEEIPKKPSCPSLPLSQVYLIPSKLSAKKFSESLTRNFDFSFEFDFGGFLPDEVYHRFLCLMLKKSTGEHSGKFTAKHFKIYNVENCNWVVRMSGSKLQVWVKHGERFVDLLPHPLCTTLFVHVGTLLHLRPMSTLSTWTSCRRFAKEREAVCRA